jgi:SAM-dependent methyltransferase
MADHTAANLRRFEVVDDAPDPGPLVTSLEVGKALPGMRLAEADLLTELDLDRARRALDVGCGLGGDTAAMRARMPPGGQVVGVDASRTMIAMARQRARDADPYLSFAVGDGRALPFPEATFDACRAESVLQHVVEPQQAVCEMARVTRPGGRVAVFEFDLGLTVLDHPDWRLTERILDGVAEGALNGWLGRQVPRFFRTAGLGHVQISARTIFSDYGFFRFVMRGPLARLVTDGVISGREAAGWLAALERADQAGHYLGGSLAFLVSGTRQ